MWTWLLALFSWAHLQLVEPIVRWWEEVVLGSWEEWLLALVRQGFEETTRFLNALGTWFLSLFSKRSYREQLRRAWQENSWQQWWGEVATRPSTLNALVANLVAQQEQQKKFGVDACEDASGAGAGGSAALQEAAGPRVESQLGVSGTAWWPRPIRQGADSMGRLKQQGVSLSARLERPVVFVQQSGMGILDELSKRRHGLIEDAKMAAQLTVSRCFDLARSTVRAVFFLPARDSLAAGSGLGRRAAAMGDGSAATTPDSSEQGGSAATCGVKRAGTAGKGGLSAASLSRGAHKAHVPRSKSAHVSIAEMAYQPGACAGSASTSMARRGLVRSRSYGRLRTVATAFKHNATETPSDALSVIRAAGYPHELHTVTTDDGYVLRLERIPRPGARDVVFFMHGVLDTSMAWVSGGVTGSQAFAAWEAGMDVWLGNSRGNAPRQHQDPSRRGWRYWQYNINHMGMYDIAAQLDHIHNVKCAELGAGTVTLDLDSLGPLAGRFLGGAGAGSAGKRLANSAAGNGLHLLQGRAVSTLAAPGVPGDVEGQAAYAGSAGARGAARMRHSNSDSNLYRWGSCNSGASSGGGRAALPDLSGGSASSGAGAPDGPQEAAGSTLLAPVTPQQLSPQQQYSATATGGSTSVASAASLGRAASTRGLLSPMASCDGSVDADGAEAPVDGGANGVDAADPSCCGELRQLRQTLQLEPSGAVSQEPVAVSGATSKHGMGRERLSSCGTATAADGGLSVFAPWTAPGSSQSSVSQSSRPIGPVCRNAVTLTVLASAVDEPTGASAVPSAAGATGPLAPTTFTLEAKTRQHFGPSTAAADPLVTCKYATGADTHVERQQQQQQQVTASTDVGSAAGSGVGAASMLGVMNSVLGPAADAVTHAVASAGAAIATAAVSATHMLRPLPHKISAAGSALTDLGTAGASVSAPPVRAGATPFAAPESQASAAADGAAEDIEGFGGERPVAVDVTASSVPQLEDAVGFSGGPVAVVPIANQGSAPAAAVAAASSPVPVLGVSGLRSQATSFRRACSSGHLAGAEAVCSAIRATNGFGGGGPAERAAALAPLRLGEPDRSGSGFSTTSGLSSSSGNATIARAETSLAGNSYGVTAGAPQQDAGPVGSRGAGPSDTIKRTATACATSATSTCPYKLRCVAHSLGGMSVLIHLINRLREGRPHHVNRLLLLTPAGFHKHCPRAAKPVMWALPVITRVIRAVLGRSFCFPLYIPTPLGRALTFKLLLSASRIPGLGELLRLCFKSLLDGDISQWDRALQMPHYSAEDMPAISVDQVLHLIQLVFTDAFRLYDYGSPAANVAHYGSTAPPDVSAEYWRLDLPVHLVGGRRDGIIPPPNIHRHLEAMRTQGVAVSYREFDFGHLDFTFGVKEELRMYLMKVLRL